MVQLTRIYTRGGDAGQTSLGDGVRVAKYSVRVAAYGTVDEANAVLGLARLHGQGEENGGGEDGADAMLARIQNEMFDLGADLCTPGDGTQDDPDKPRLRMQGSQVDRLEAEIDAMNAHLHPLTSFILPGGSVLSAHLHHARTLVRRAERLVAELADQEPVNPVAIKYINRLSDHMFVLARVANGNGASDVLWRPGATR